MEQAIKMKYLGIHTDDIYRLSEHISYAAEKCAKLIHRLSKSAKISWRLKHEALKTVYEAAVLPVLLYGAPAWIEAAKCAYNRLKFTLCICCILSCLVFIVVVVSCVLL